MYVSVGHSDLQSELPLSVGEIPGKGRIILCTCPLGLAFESKRQRQGMSSPSPEEHKRGYTTMGCCERNSNTDEGGTDSVTLALPGSSPPYPGGLSQGGQLCPHRRSWALRGEGLPGFL